MSNHKLLKFFNKEGDYLNFNYSDINDRFEGDILFSENSSDTFKTVGLYMLESIPSFEFESPGDLGLNKFQLFNEYGLNFYGSISTNQTILNIEPVNNDPGFYSKWIYGNDFDVKFPIGTIVKFDNIFLEFTNTSQTYTVSSVKKGAILIISSVDNATFESTYFVGYSNPSIYIGKTISGINAIGVYNYIDSLYNDNLSLWNEPTFYDKIYSNKKLNIVKSDKNDGVVTIIDENITDINHFEYYTNGLPTGKDLIIEISTKTDLLKLYDGSLDISSDSKLTFGSSIPEILKPNTEFKIVGSLLNQIFLTVSYIPTFTGNTQQTFYATQSQVIWNNKIYQCIQSYTQSFYGTTQFTTPDNTNYWTNYITYLQVDQTTSTEHLSGCQIYLTTDKVYFNYGWTQSSSVTLASAAEMYKADLKLFNIDLYYDNKLKADLIYPSKYAVVNFYNDQIGSSYSIGGVTKTSERLIQVSEKLNYELNYNLSSNFNINIVFTDLDEYGIKIIIDKQVYEEEISWIYSGSNIDVERTIDRTIRAWLTRNYLRLASLGIMSEIRYIGNFTSPFNNSISLKTQYPNVPINITDILVGITADYHIEHSKVLFNEIGPYLSININSDKFDISTIYKTGTYSQYPDISATLKSWVDEHGTYLKEFGIIVSNINIMLKFDVKKLDRRLDYTINTGKINLPGINDYIITKKLIGNEGMIITSNEVTLPSSSLYSFEDIGFATGMAFSINNTLYPFNNQEYNIQFLDPSIMSLSYQGPFWGTSNICNSSAFITLAFEIGFGQTACATPTLLTSIGGPFNSLQFSNAFSITYNTNTYIVNYYDLISHPGTSRMVDILYVQISNSIYALGDDISVLDSFTSNYITGISLLGNTQSISITYNPVNNYLYCLSPTTVFVVDPLINSVITTIPLSNIANDIEINTNNGDIYISYKNIDHIDIYEYTNILNTTIITPSINDTNTSKMVFNEFEKDMYIMTDDTGIDNIIRINGTVRTISTTYDIPGATNSMFYEPVNESIYVYGSNSLWKIDNGITYSIPLVTTSPFNDIIFNNLTGEINISDSSTSFKSLNLSTNSVDVNSSIGNYGYLALNQFDGDVYLSSLLTNSIVVIRAATGSAIHIESLSAGTTKIIYNPDRKSICAIQPSTNTIVEIMVTVNSTINILPSKYTNIEDDNLYGTLHPDYQPHPDIWLKSKDYVRKPRENFEGDVSVKYYWKWYSDNVPEFFMYDFFGNQLPISGSYAYTGEKPLPIIILNENPNTDILKTSSPESQQTIFKKVENKLSYIDDIYDISTEPEPLQLFLGFKSEEEGSLRSILQLWKEEVISIDIESTHSNNTTLTFETLDEFGPDKRGQIKISTSSSEEFTKKGLKEGQHISIYVKDITNTKNQYTSHNNGTIVKIRNIFYKTLIVDFFSQDDIIDYEQTVINNYPIQNSTTYCKSTFTVIDREIGRFITYGQTEIEDIRFKIELGNIGKLVSPNEVFIFKEYDILEGGIDWIYLNKKRKEMLMMKHLIYPYIGSYKSIINAINFFGYNDLQLNEYYKDINPDSERFLKLFKVEIPDIFDNSVEGFTISDFITNNFPNENYEETNMFNLTYFITDKDGNNILNYSIDEVVIKLQGLKYWLKRNIIPLTHKILDITGNAYFTSQSEILHTSYDVISINRSENMTPITLKLNEAYLMPINSGSTVYNCVVDFYTIVDGVGADKNPTGTIDPPKPFNGVSLELPDYFDILIRTYKTYKEWAPFTVYNIGDRIIYYGKIYESQIINRVNNPRKYETSPTWNINSIYQSTNIVKYNREFYVCGGTSSTTPPNLDISNWLKITEWKEIELEPVQTIKEFRKIDISKSNPILPFNFTIDSNLDSFITIEVTSDNGYGLIYRDKKNYEIRGSKDLVDPVRYIDTIGPFIPITPIS